MKRYGIISPADWGLAPADPGRLHPWAALGVNAAEWEERARQATYHWLLRNWQEEGAFAGHYRARRHTFEPPQLTNLIAPWQCMVAYDRYGDEDLLNRAASAATWAYENLVETHPMSMVVGGVRDSWRPEEVWTKFTAEFVILNLGLYVRNGDQECMRRALESVRFLLQAELHDHAVKYDHEDERWVTRGWQSFGRIVEAYLYLYEITQDNRWLGRALSWGEYALTLQAPDWAFYLVNGEYYNSDIAADELRALIFLHDYTQLPQFRLAATRFADWHLNVQRPDGAWVLTRDRFGNPVSDYVGPGDVPNIAIALLRIHQSTNDDRYLASALRAMHYALSKQVVPGGAPPWADREDVLWGYWSWDPHYDYTMSGDQVTHFCRGLWFMMDYLVTLSPERAEGVIAVLEPLGIVTRGPGSSPFTGGGTLGRG